jgi:hypothetical protein
MTAVAQFRLLHLALLASLVGCGGVSEGTPINDLTEDDWAELCADATEGWDAVSQDCGAYVADIPAYTAADCEADVAFLTAGCDAVVGDWQTCMAGRQAADPCFPNRDLPSACDIVAECDPNL